MVTNPKCWKCGKPNISEQRIRVGRTRTSAEQIAAGADDENMYRKFLICGEDDCGYRWSPYQDRYLRRIVYNSERNGRFADLAARFARSGQPVLVYVELIEHINLLNAMIRDRLALAGLDPNVCQAVNGTLEDAHNEGVKAALKSKKVLVVVVNRIWGEGTDIKSIRWVLYAKAGKPGIDLEQVIGRALRISPGKFRAGFIDSQDQFDAEFRARAVARANYLSKKGFGVRVLSPVDFRGRRKYRVSKNR